MPVQFKRPPSLDGLIYPSLPLFIVDAAADVKVERDGTITFDLVSTCGAYVTVTTNDTTLIQDTVSIQHPWATTPYGGWVDIGYEYPQINANAPCEITDSQGVYVGGSPYISLTEQQAYVLNAMISIAASEGATS